MKEIKKISVVDLMDEIERENELTSRADIKELYGKRMSVVKPKSLAELIAKPRRYYLTGECSGMTEEAVLVSDLKQLQEQIAKLDFSLCVLLCQSGCKVCTLKELRDVLGLFEKGEVLK